VSRGRSNGNERKDRLPWFVYAIPVVLLALIVAYAIVASWIPAT
jgi:hypothetical protein